MNLNDYVILGVPLMLLVLGLVEWIKKTGLPAQYLPYVSMGLGILFGAGYQFSTSGFPVDFAGWFGAIVFGISAGLTASGVYDVINNKTNYVEVTRGEVTYGKEIE